MRNVLLILALMGIVCSTNAQTKTNCKKNLHNKTVSDKPVFTYRKNNVPVKSPAAINDNSQLISFEAEGTYIARYPKTPKLAAK